METTPSKDASGKGSVEHRPLLHLLGMLALDALEPLRAMATGPAAMSSPW